MLIFPMLFMGGCSADADAVYDYASTYLGEATDEELELLAEGKLGTYFDTGEGVGLVDGSLTGGIYGILSGICTLAKRYGVFIIIGSILIGVILIRLAPKAIKVRRAAWGFFIIGVPLLVLFLIFGTAFLADAFAG